MTKNTVTITTAKTTIFSYYLTSEGPKIMSITGSMGSHEAMALREGPINISLNKRDSQHCSEYFS